MKVTVTEKENEQEIKFPCLIKSSDLLILAIAKTDKWFEGTVITQNNNYEIGHYSKSWILLNPEPFNGTITLQND